MQEGANTLLLVEDEEHLSFTLEFNLSQEGYEVDVAASLTEARTLKDKAHDLILLDVMLPDGIGFDFCQELREEGIRTPILFLTAKGSSDDIVNGLESGGDDYITKPFQLKELLARIGALIRRKEWLQQELQSDKQQLQTYQFANNSIDFTTHEVIARGKPVELTALELKLIHFFIEHEDTIVTRQEILEHVWQVSPNVHTRTVDNFLVRLRRVFESDPRQPEHFVTIRGAGYRFSPNP